MTREHMTRATGTARPRPHPRRRATARRAMTAALPAVIGALAVIVVWQILVDVLHVSSRVISSPTQIVRSMIDTWPQLMSATRVTAFEAVTGFLIAIIAGVAMGVGLYLSSTLYHMMYPALVAAQTIPLIAIAPLFMIWFGFEATGKIVLVAVLGLFPIAVQTCRGLLAVPHFYEDVALTCGATRPWTLWHVTLVVAGRQIFGGIRISAAYVYGTAVTAEYLGAVNGLGIWLQAAFNSFRTPPIFSATIVIIALTGLLLAAVSIAERLVLGPSDESSDMNYDSAAD